MHPIERLRWIARAEGESDAMIAAEAAWTLGELAIEEPAAVLTASRRLVLRQPHNGPLWWACARLLEAVGSSQVLDLAQHISVELSSDTVPARLADGLRSELTSTDVIVATVPAELLARAVEYRDNHRLLLVGEYRELRLEVSRLRANSAVGYEIEEAAEALEQAALVLVEPRFASAGQVVVSASAAATVRLANKGPLPVWAVFGPGRVLSEPLAAAATKLLGPEEEPLSPSLFDQAVDEEGLGPIEAALERPCCPLGLELARLHGLGS
jgi:hypothetical protein